MNPETRSHAVPRPLALGLLCLGGWSAHATEQAEAGPIVCESLQHCISQIGSVESHPYGLSRSQRELAAEFPKFGEPALRYLLSRLETEDEDERENRRSGDFRV